MEESGFNILSCVSLISDMKKYQFSNCRVVAVISSAFLFLRSTRVQKRVSCAIANIDSKHGTSQTAALAVHCLQAG